MLAWQSDSALRRLRQVAVCVRSRLVVARLEVFRKRDRRTVRHTLHRRAVPPLLDGRVVGQPAR